MTTSTPRPYRFAFFGDSICVGQGVAIHKTWTARLSRRLAEVVEAQGMELVSLNASVNGDTTRMALERMPFDIQARGVDGILVQFGLNDANYWETDRGLPRVSEEAFAANVKEIIARARNVGARLVMLNTNHPTTRDAAPMPHAAMTYETSNRRYNDIVREVAAADGEGVLLNDVHARFAELIGDDPGALARLVLEDGLHLSEAGHDAYFEFLAPAASKAVEATLAGRPVRA